MLTSHNWYDPGVRFARPPTSLQAALKGFAQTKLTRPVVRLALPTATAVPAASVDAPMRISNPHARVSGRVRFSSLFTVTLARLVFWKVHVTFAPAASVMVAVRVARFPVPPDEHVNALRSKSNAADSVTVYVPAARPMNVCDF